MTPPKSNPTPVRIFYSYSHKDEAYRDELEEHLSLIKRQGLIHSWHDRRISAGQEWQGVIDENLEAANVILCLNRTKQDWYTRSVILNSTEAQPI